MTESSFKQQQIINFVAIASTITACSITPQLGLNKPLSKIHIGYRRMDEATAKSEIDRTADLIYKTTLFRPPGGFLNNGLAV